MDTQRFGQIAKGLHASTTFEQADLRHYFKDRQGSLLCKIDDKHLLVTGPHHSIDVLNAKDLSKIANLNTDGKMAFCAVRKGDLLFAGCVQGLLFSWRIGEDNSSFSDRQSV